MFKPIHIRAVMIVFAAAAIQATAHAARVAILLDSPTQTLPQAVSIAETQLFEPNSGVTLVERQAIDRVLAEQKITESLGNADQAVAIGKLVSAEVLAVVEPAADGKQVDGLVIFDCDTGVRLEDATLPIDPSKAADLISSRIKDAMVKRDLPIAQRRSVCLMTIRNADLPMEAGGICPAVGKLLERRLTHSSAITVLERSRLDKVNQERALPTADDRIKQLVATLTAMELQASGDSRDEIKLTCILTDPAGKPLGSPSVTGRAADLAKLTDALADAICKSLSVAPVVNQGDRQIEASRFLNEARFRWSHLQRGDALRDAQAAFALDPDSAVNRAALMRALMERGAEITGGFADNNDPNRVQLFPLDSVTARNIDVSLLLVKQSTDMPRSTRLNGTPHWSCMCCRRI
jgi:hypothetical protein